MKKNLIFLFSLMISGMAQAAMHTHCESGDGQLYVDGIHYGTNAESLFRLVLVNESLSLKSTSQSGVSNFETATGELVVIARDISSAVVYTAEGSLREVLNCRPHP